MCPIGGTGVARGPRACRVRGIGHDGTDDRKGWHDGGTTTPGRWHDGGTAARPGRLCHRGGDIHPPRGTARHIRRM